MTQKILLKGTVKGMQATVDNEDYEAVSQHTWKWYGRYPEAFIEGKVVRLARFLMNPPSGMVVGYINKDRLDNRKENLIVCTRLDMVRLNKPIRKERVTSKYKGVGFWRGRWRAGITRKGKHRSLGAYNTEEKAARAYDAAALILDGKRTYLNFESSRYSDMPSTLHHVHSTGNSNSGYRGVHRQTPTLWTAKIGKGGVVHYLGVFNNPVDAARAYNTKALELYGDDAKLNQVEGGK